METNKAFNKKNQEESFRQIFKFKGEITPIAEKANKNLEFKSTNKLNSVRKIHYFAIGHAFKQMDIHCLFAYQLNDQTQKLEPTQFKSLKTFDELLCQTILKQVSNLRNIYNHYIHSFEGIKMDADTSQLSEFIHESFKLAVIQTFYLEKSKKKAISLAEFIGEDRFEMNIVRLLCDRFYPFNAQKEYPDSYIQTREYFSQLSLDHAIEKLLWVDVEEDYSWKLNQQLDAFSIAEGRYLSFYGGLFLLSMFLYKSEANQLISKIKGFKRNGTPEEQSKRDIFTFFAKKFSSQDIDSEENHLVKFRDIIQYLNKYPVEWNRELELKPQYHEITGKLKELIVDMEIERLFEDLASNDRFKVYAKYQLGCKRHLGKKVEQEYIASSFKSEEIESFNSVLNTSPELKGLYEKRSNLAGRNPRERQRVETDILRLENLPNPQLEKFKKLMDSNMLHVSYGRNQDRFMELALRFLAETSFFGDEAQFKLYQCFTTDEQNEKIEKLKLELKDDTERKKIIDGLKYHRGRLVDYTTWENHLQKDASWDTPFVIEDNAHQIKIKFLNGVERIVSVQRSLMVYLLQHALALAPEKMKGAGQVLLTAYFNHHQKEFDAKMQNLKSNIPIQDNEKSQYKKLFPKRLVGRHLQVPLLSTSGNIDTLRAILEKAKLAEERYSLLVQKARQDNRYDEFVNRNKGKQFKLQFVRKAWNLMYFRDSYNEQVNHSVHHKRFHITRDEFNDFSRFMFAFDEVPAYKDFLRGLLDAKGFFNNEAFRTLFEQGRSLDEFYKHTKRAFEMWLQTAPAHEPDADKYTLPRYENLLGVDMFYINLSHFVAYLRDKVWKLAPDAPIQFAALENKAFLISDYYVADKFDKAVHGKAKKLFNELQSVRLEDALLYEMAMRYLKHDADVSKVAKTSVRKILTSTLEFDIQNLAGELAYRLLVPFKKIDSLAEIRVIKFKKGKSNMGLFLPNIVFYLELIWSEIPDYERKQGRSRLHGTLFKQSQMLSQQSVEERLVQNEPLVLTLDDLNKVNQHLLSTSNKLSRLIMVLERYYITKPNDKGVVELFTEPAKVGGVYVPFKNTNIPEMYFKEVLNGEVENYRDIVSHFDFPQRNSHVKWLEILEKQFLKDEIGATNIPNTFEDLPKPLKMVCLEFLTVCHNELFGREKDGKKKMEEAKRQYVERVIKNAII